MKLHICFLLLSLEFFCINVRSWPCESIGESFTRSDGVGTLSFNILQELSNAGVVKVINILNYNNSVVARVLYQGTTVAGTDVLPGFEVTGNTSGQVVLKIKPPQAVKKGIYWIDLFENDKCICLFVLGIPTTPSISKDKDPSVGESVTFTCSSTSTTTPSNHSLSLVYNWRVDSLDDPSGPGYTYSASRQILTLSSVVKDDASKQFTCTSTENVPDGYTSSRSNVASLSVFYGPDGVCDNVSSLHTFTEGDSTASIRCFSECYPGCSYTWSNGSGQLSNSEVLSLGSVRRYQAGTYTFSVRNTAQTYSKSAQKIFVVLVKYAPVVSIELSTTKHPEGTSLTLFCRGEGVPPNYIYTGLSQAVGGVRIPNTVLEHTEAYSDIHFFKLRLQDTGNYTCRMNNGIRDLNGTLDQTGTVQLLVEVQPKILEDDLKYAGAQGIPVTVQVQFYCYPAVQSVTFVRYDGTVIQNSTKYRTSFITGKVNVTFYGKEVTLKGYIAVLTINDLEEEDFVNYTLTVENSRGTTSELIFILAESIPSIPKSFFLSSTGLLFIWEKGFNGGHLQTFIIQVSADGMEQWQNLSSMHENEASHQVNSTFFSVEIKGLDPGTYFARLIAANSLGETEPLYLNTTFTVMSYESTTEHSSKVVAGVVGGSVSAIVVIALVVGVVVWRRRVVNNALGTKQETHKRHLQEGQSTYCDLMKTDTNERSNYSDLKLYERSTEVSAYGKLAGADERDRNRTYASLCPETREPSRKEGHDKTYVNLVVKK